MTQVYVAAEREVGAPAGLVYAILADYTQHHPRILPPAFSDFHVERGGVGAGSVIRYTYARGGTRRSFQDAVAEPEPGRVLTETDATGKTDKVTTFTVTPLGDRCRVRIETRWTPHGLRGVIERLFAPRMLRPGMVDQLERLDRYARELARARA